MHLKRCLTNPTSSHLYLATTLLNHLATPPISLSIQGIVSRAQPLLRDLLITGFLISEKNITELIIQHHSRDSPLLGSPETDSGSESLKAPLNIAMPEAAAAQDSHLSALTSSFKVG